MALHAEAAITRQRCGSDDASWHGPRESSARLRVVLEVERLALVARFDVDVITLVGHNGTPRYALPVEVMMLRQTSRTSSILD